MSDRPWKAEERAVARLLKGTRYAANSGGRIDVESARDLAQVKNVARLSLAELEALAVEIAAIGEQRGKLGLLVVKRRAGRGQATPRLIVFTEGVWQAMHATGAARTESLGVEKEEVNEN